MTPGGAATPGGPVTPGERPAAIVAWEAADRRQDLDVMRAQLARDVELISPLTDGFRFRGVDEVMAVFEAAFELLTDIEIVALTGADVDWVLHGANRLDGANLEEVQWLHLDSEGHIDRITLFIRPAPAAVSLLSRIGPPLARRGALGRAGAAASAAARPLAAALRLTEARLMPTLKREESI